MSEKVTVTVSGPTGSGKSAIYGEIVLALQAIGVPVVHGDPQEAHYEAAVRHGDWMADIEMYQPTVTMVEENLSRDGRND